jgi:hypothetical protein
VSEEAQESSADVPDDLAARLAQDPLQKAVDPKLLVSSNGKGPPATRKRLGKGEGRAPKVSCHAIHFILLDITCGPAHSPLAAEIFVPTPSPAVRWWRQETTCVRGQRRRAAVAAEKEAAEKAKAKKIDNIFITNIINDKIKVVSLSDIHGDIHSFIIALRDCAKVIKKKRGFNFNQTTLDKDMEKELKKDIFSDELRKSNYKADLNYKWCGVNTYVVICGDIIDPYRSKPFLPKCLKKEKKKINYQKKNTNI